MFHAFNHIKSKVLGLTTARWGFVTSKKFKTYSKLGIAIKVPSLIYLKAITREK
jgi:hypothetical protein